LRGVTGSGGTSFIESRLELSESFGSGTRTNTIITVNNDSVFLTFLINNSSFKGDNFSLEPTVLLSIDGLDVRRGSESILLSTSNLIFSSDVFRGDTI
jgi:hypothetical protein